MTRLFLWRGFMKKLYSLLVASIISATFNASATDQSAALSINARIGYGASAACKVEAAKGSIMLYNVIGKQGEDAEKGIASTPIHVYGVKDMSDCYDAITTGHIALTLSGLADESEGTVLANTYQSNEHAAAKGIGIGLYQFSTGKLLRVNSSDYLHFDSLGSTVATLGLSMVNLKGQTVQPGIVAGSVTVGIEHL